MVRAGHRGATVTPQDERELALRIRMALLANTQGEEQLLRSAASRLAEQPRESQLPWQLQVGPL